MPFGKVKTKIILKIFFKTFTLAWFTECISMYMKFVTFPIMTRLILGEELEFYGGR